MIKALFFKEWLKLRYFLWIPFIMAGAALGDYCLTLKGVLAMHGAVDTWNGIIAKETIYFTSLQWTFILGGIWIAAVQMVPECVNKRLRLLCHLPVQPGTALGVQVVTGLSIMLVLFGVVSCGFFVAGMYFGFPSELTMPMFRTMLPWGLAGAVAWCATAAAVADPSFKRKVAVVLIGIGYMTMLTGGRGYASMDASFWLYCLVCLPWPLAFGAAALRVKEGA